tara:strand:+ start:121778 stop:122836 length:1059 start_codon:yes stop_codon:yes gene_type:complete
MVASRSAVRQSGFSLVELMVGMVLGLMLIAGAVSIYLASKRSYVEVEQVAALTESARFAEQIVGESLRHIGFLGELPANKIDVAPALTATSIADDCDSPANAYGLSRLVYAATVDNGNDALGCITDGKENTDVLVIKRVVARPYTAGPRVRDPNDPPSATINTPLPLDNGRTYVMTNNITGLLFDGSTPPSIINGGQVPGGSAWEYQYEVFYIRDRDPLSTDDTPHLSRRVLAYNSSTSSMEFQTEDLAEGVENMQLLFGYDSSGDGEVDSYGEPPPAGPGTWDDVVSIEVFLLIRSATRDLQYTDSKTYQLGGDPNEPMDTVGPMDDNYRRLISHVSVSLRNVKLMIRGGV